VTRAGLLPAVLLPLLAELLRTLPLRRANRPQQQRDQHQHYQRQHDDQDGQTVITTDQ
jgi:hypothetical protein